MPRIIESVPNISEGRRPEVVKAAVDALGKVAGVRVLDVQSDKDHNRSVISLAGDEKSLPAALLNLFEVAVDRIDLRSHDGEHPRAGAVDVVPFIPIEGATMADCVALARQLGQAVAERYGVSVVGSEIVGLVPAEALMDAADFYLRLENFNPSQVLERKLRESE